MRWLALPERRARQLRRFRRRTWLLVALCFVARGADAALGLDLIEHIPPVAAQDAATCPHDARHSGAGA